MCEIVTTTKDKVDKTTKAPKRATVKELAAKIEDLESEIKSIRAAMKSDRQDIDNEITGLKRDARADTEYNSRSFHALHVAVKSLAKRCNTTERDLIRMDRQIDRPTETLIRKSTGVGI